MVEISFTDREVVVEGYRYPPSSCYPQRVVPATEITDVSPMSPITIRLRCRDVLFVSKELDAPVRAFADRNRIPVICRYDPWSFVLQPFLDTKYTRDIHSRMLQLLEMNGISKRQCNRWRRRFRRAMLSYNFDSGLWEWGDLGATDLLDAHMGILAKPKYRLNERRFSELYELVISVLFNAAEILQD
jgi:hypothetical protein